MSVTEAEPSRPRIPAPADAPETVRMLARRVDWRFLLPDPAPARVALLGPADDSLPRAFAALGIPAARFASAEAAADAAGAGGGFDLVLLADGDASAAGKAARLVGPGGTLRWETRGGPSAREARAALAGTGMDAVAVHWIRPSHAAALESIPLDAPGILDHVLRGGTHGTAGETRRAAARLLRRVGLLEMATPCRAVIARRGPPPTGGIAAELRRRAAALGGGAAEEVRILLRSPRFRASAHVLLFAFVPGAPDPALIAKVARVPGPGETLRREAASLQRLAALAGTPMDGVPDLVAQIEVAGVRAILETVVPGVPVHPERVRRDPAGCLGPFVEWIGHLHARTRMPAAEGAWREAAVLAPLRRIESVFGSSGPVAELAARTREIAGRIGPDAAFWVFEHGDLSAPNLLLHADRPGVVDWELGTPHGVAGADPFVLLAFAARARRRASEPPAVGRALREAFFGADPWAAPWVRRYAARIGLPPAAAPALFVVAWSRYVAATLERLAEDHAEGTPAGELREWLRREPCFVAWEEAVRGFEHLRPAGTGGAE